MKLFAIASLLLLFSSPVAASDWRFVTSTERTAFAVETSGIRREGTMAFAWMVLANHHRGEPINDYQVGLVAFDCSRSRMNFESLLSYRWPRELLDRGDRQPPFDIPPDSTWAQLLGLICHNTYPLDQFAAWPTAEAFADVALSGGIRAATEAIRR